MVVEEKFPGGHFPKCIVLQAVYWYLRYSLSYRDIEELMGERGIELDHATVQRWVVKYTPLIEAEFRKKKKIVGSSWRMDETYFKIKGIRHNGIPEKITIDGSAANKAAIEEYNSDKGTSIEIRQVKYLNNIVEQDHRGIKRITNSILGFKSFRSARITLNGIEVVHMLRKMQIPSQTYAQNLAETFYSLAA